VRPVAAERLAARAAERSVGEMRYDARPGECGRCQHFSIKGEIGDGTPGVGRCDNPRVHEQVRIRGKQIIESHMQRLKVPQWEITAELNEVLLRFTEDFGCKHFEDDGDWEQDTEEPSP
jgi:hypothetical protein